VNGNDGPSQLSASARCDADVAQRRAEEAIGRLDESLRRMGSDPCLCAFDLLVEEVVAQEALDAGEQSELRALLRGRLGLHI
jgi:hypothetical protein